MKVIFDCRTCQETEHYESMHLAELDVGLVQLLMMMENFRVKHYGHDCEFMSERESVWIRK